MRGSSVEPPPPPLQELRRRAAGAFADKEHGLQTISELLEGPLAGKWETAVQVLGMNITIENHKTKKNEEVTLLAWAFRSGRFDIAIAVLRFLLAASEAAAAAAPPWLLNTCLRPPPADGRSIMQIMVEDYKLRTEEIKVMTEAVQRAVDDDQDEDDSDSDSDSSSTSPRRWIVFGEMDQAMDLLHEAYCVSSSSRSSSSSSSLDWKTVVNPYAIFCRDQVPSPITDNIRQTDQFMPRASIVVSAHAVDVVEEDELTKTPTRYAHFRATELTVLYYGPGVCDETTYVHQIDSRIDRHEGSRAEFERAVVNSTWRHETGTLATMQKLQTQLREMYAAKFTSDHASGTRAAAVIAARQHCKIVHGPYLDRKYTYAPGGALRLVQSFNAPAYNDLVGRALFGPEMRRRMRVHHPRAANMVDALLESQLINYRGSICVLRLSQIVRVMEQMGFGEVINVYDYSCRDFQTAQGQYLDDAMTPERRKGYARRVDEEEDSTAVASRAYGGGRRRTAPPK